MIFEFETFTLDVGCRELRRDGKLRPLEPQVFDLLSCLIQNSHRIVTLDEVLQDVWRGRSVSDSTVHTRLHAARVALNDTGTLQRLIQTVRGRGFRFIGAVRELEAAPRSISHTIAGISPMRLERLVPSTWPGLVVLPFADLGGDLGTGCVAAFDEEARTTLSRLDGLSVVAAQSVKVLAGRRLTARQIAQEIGAGYVLSGGVRRAGNRICVTAQLVDGLTDRNIWADRYVRIATSLDVVQEGLIGELAATVSRQLLAFELQRIRHVPKADQQSWESLLLALSLINSRDKARVADAEALMRQTIGSDPHSSKAHSLLSFIQTLRVHQGWQTRALQIPLALQAARDALDLNPDEAWAHLALGYAMIWVHPTDAVVALQKAIELNRHLAFGHYLLGLATAWSGFGELALQQADLAELNGPTDLLSRGNAGTVDSVRATACFAVARYDDGIRFAKRAIADSPAMPSAHRALLMNCAHAGETDQALSTLKRIVQLSPGFSLAWIKENTVWTRQEDRTAYTEAFRIAGLRH